MNAKSDPPKAGRRFVFAKPGNHAHGHGNCSEDHDHGARGHTAQRAEHDVVPNAPVAAPRTSHGGHGHGAGHGGHGAGHGGHGHGIPVGANLSGAFAIATTLNAAFVIVEFSVGLAADSTALLADATHNLSDVLGLLLAWGAERMSKRQPSDRYTYGFRRTTVLAALSNAVLLLVAVGGVLREAVARIWSPPTPAGMTLIAVATAGVVVNGACALLFSRHSHNDANVRGAFLHLLADAVVSLAVVIVGAVLFWQPQWVWLDPLVGALISLVILVGTWRLLRDSLHLSLDGVPANIDLGELKAQLKAHPGVLDIHDLHVWSLSTSETALTAHLVVSAEASRELASRASRQLAAQFGIDHVTLQLDTPDQMQDCQTC
jgi:cobalt-zinc-cadmium efflux system protein